METEHYIIIIDACTDFAKFTLETEIFIEI